MNKFFCLGLLIMLSMSVYCESPVESKTPETILPKTESSVADIEKSPKTEVPSAAETPKSEVPVAKELPVPAEPTKPATETTETPKSEVPVAAEAPIETPQPENTTPTATPVTPQPSVAHKVLQHGSNIAYYCGVFVFLLIALVGGIVGLSTFYKYRMNTMKQAPFTPPAFLSTKLFPRDHSYYFEYETELGGRDEELSVQADASIARYLN